MFSAAGKGLNRRKPLVIASPPVVCPKHTTAGWLFHSTPVFSFVAVVQPRT
ncbi:hypothetical protein Hanom_Chr10g00893211 [Helianthus anomalus]